MYNNILRQVIDIQNQIKNLGEDFGAEELHSILSYNAEIKKYLVNTTTDNFILPHINEIPEYKMKDFKIGFDFIGLLVGLFSGRFESFNDQKYDFSKAEVALHKIENKYASLEQMLKG